MRDAGSGRATHDGQHGITPLGHLSRILGFNHSDKNFGPMNTPVISTSSNAKNNCTTERARMSTRQNQRISRPVPPRRRRGEVHAARADWVPALVGRGPASPDAACPIIGGAVVGVTSPGRPKGRWAVHAAAHPSPLRLSRRGDRGEMRRREARVRRV